MKTYRKLNSKHKPFGFTGANDYDSKDNLRQVVNKSGVRKALKREVSKMVDEARDVASRPSSLLGKVESYHKR
jgi:hypothetical protein